MKPHAIAVTIICLLAIGCTEDSDRGVKAGAKCKVNGIETPVLILDMVGHFSGTTRRAYHCRVDNGPGASPRFSVATFRSDELTPIAEGPEKP